jgi:hypothetical protein
MILYLAVLCAFTSAAPAMVHAQASSSVQEQKNVPLPLSAELLSRIPEDLRQQALTNIRLSEREQARRLKLSPEKLRESTIRSLADSPAAMDFVLDLLPREPSPENRSSILSSMPYREHWRRDPRTQKVLAALVSSDPNVGVIGSALETLRTLQMLDLRSLLDQRIQMARAGSDQEITKALAEEQERWISLQRGVMLPGFLRAIPPVFSVKPSDQSVKIVAFGDFGTGSPEQKHVAASIVAEHRKRAFDFGITTGDNFYPRGMASTSDPRWKTYWEDLYTTLGIKFYASLGNHDWFHPDSPAAEILYSDKSQSWRMPAPYYTYTAGPVQLFAVDTNDMGEQQISWLKNELEKSRAKWKVVYGHFPVYAASTYGPGYTEKPRKHLLPVIKGKADIYICGHHHSMQHLQPDGGTHFFITGGGGASNYPIGTRDEERGEPILFAKSVFGFTALEVDEKELVLRYIGMDGNQLYSFTLRK